MSTRDKLIAFLRAANWDHNKGATVKELTALASSACYFAPDSISRESIAPLVYMHRAEKLEACAAKRKCLAGYEKDVAYRINEAAKYRELAAQARS